MFGMESQIDVIWKHDEKLPQIVEDRFAAAKLTGSLDLTFGKAENVPVNGRLVISALSSLLRVRSIRFGKFLNQFNEEELRKIADRVAHISSLCNLSISPECFTSRIEIFAQVIRSLPALSSLDLNGSMVDLLLQAILGKRLVSLKLRNTPAIRNNCKIQELLQATHSLEELDLSNDFLVYWAVNDWSRLLCGQRIRRLNLSYNKLCNAHRSLARPYGELVAYLTERDYRAMADMLVRSGVEQLDMSGNFINWMTIDLPGSRIFSNALALMNNLKVLILDVQDCKQPVLKLVMRGLLENSRYPVLRIKNGATSATLVPDEFCDAIFDSRKEIRLWFG